MRFPIGAMTVGDILDRGLKLLLARLPTFYLISLIVQIPLLAYQIALPKLAQMGFAGGTDSRFGAFIGGTFLVSILAIILRPIGVAATLHVIAKEFVNEQVGLGGAFRFALGRFGSLLWVSILSGLIIGIGFMLLVIPGILFYVWYVFAGQVVVVEGRGGMKALDRSKALTQGFRWRVFGLLVLLILIGMLFGFVANLLQQYAFPGYELVMTDGEPSMVLNYRNHVIGLIIAFLINSLVESLTAVCLTLFYFDLRIRKEGFDLELAAKEQVPTV